MRVYEQRPLSEEDLEKINQIQNSVMPLFPKYIFSNDMQTREKKQNIVEILGAYGHIISPPYYFVPSIHGKSYPLIDLGFRMQQIAVGLWSIGIGSCFIGCLSREAKVRQLFMIPPEDRIAAFLVFGYPARSNGIQSLIEIGKFAKGNSGRKKIEEVFFYDDFNSPGLPPTSLEKILECAQAAPSAVNAQPWRFLLRNKKLFLYVNCKPKQFLLPENDDYCFHDGGTCLANIFMAANSLGIKMYWEFIDHMSDNRNLPKKEFLVPLVEIIIKN